MGLRTVTADFLLITEKPLSQRVPMPMRFCMKFGMICHWGKGNCNKVMVQDNMDLCACTVDVPTMTGGAFILRSTQGNYVVMYMTLAPESKIAMSLGSIIVGEINIAATEVSST